MDWVNAMLQRMQLEGVQLAVVTLEDGSQFVITNKDLIKRLLPQDSRPYPQSW